jgi:hypothetical protein
MNSHRIIAALLGAIVLASCEKNAVQVLPSVELPGARVKFFHFGVSAPGVNFYANETKMTAIVSGTGTESSTGAAYGAAGAGGAYTAIAPGQYTLTGRIAAAGTDKNLPIATVAATIEDGKFYSFYMSGIYNTTLKTVDAFVVEDPVAPPSDYSVAYVRFVNAISNATNPLTLYVKNTTGDTATVTVATAVAYKGASAFTTIPAGVFNLFARYPDSTANKVTRNGVTFLAGRLYTVGARGNITVASGATAPALDNTANR